MPEYNYLPADKSIFFNDDDLDLVPIEYKLPKTPKLESIEGYGLPPQDQYWRHKPMPPKLAELQRNQKLTPSQKIRKLEDAQSYYADEIRFIEQEWERTNNGHWLFINGKPYYITGDNYYYLQWWSIERRPPVFRMRDRKWWLFVEMMDKDSYCMGMNYPKGRREGATTRASCKRLKVASRTPNARVGLQSKEDSHAKEVHQTHVLDIFKYETPFWFIPVWDQNMQNKTSINFYAPDGKDHVDNGKPALRTIVDYRPSNKTAYDGLKLQYLHNDEIGKSDLVDVYERWNVQRECLVQGSRIIGKSINTSTVEEMEGGGGKEFKLLCDESHYEQRNKETGRTATGLYNFFMPSYEGFGDDMPPHYQTKYGHKSWVDKYGFDVLDPDTGRPLAERYLLGLRQSYLDSNNIEAWIDQVRKYPLRWKDCWKRKASANNFNLEIIEARLDYYRNGNDDVQIGDFMWEGGVQDTKVIWVPNKEGRWKLSYQFADPSMSNRYFLNDGKKFPFHTQKFVAGADTFKFRTTKEKKKSKGGIAVFYKFDPSVDQTHDIGDWKSNRFCCTYLYRPRDKRTYLEDVLMTCIYFGCKVYPEFNVPDVGEHFIDRGYGGYLLYRIDSNTGKVEVNPGEQTGTKTIESIFSHTQHHIQHHGHREFHDDWLLQCKEIEDDMGDYDLFAAGGYALLGAAQDSFEHKRIETVDLSDFLPTFEYNDN